jgi:tetratricopeptide (TPR) repeat protein
MQEKRPAQPAESGQTQLTINEAYGLAVEHFNAQRYQKVEQLCTAILQAFPDHLETINLLGVLAQKVNRDELAVELFQRAIDADDTVANFHYNLGVSFVQLGKKDEAVTCYQKALLIESDFYNAHYNLGVVLQEQEKLTEAHG